MSFKLCFLVFLGLIIRKKESETLLQETSMRVATFISDGKILRVEFE